MMNSIGNILFNKQKQSALLKGVAGAMVVEEANKKLAELFGSEILNHANAAYLKNDILCIACLNTVAAQEIRLRESEILSAIQSKIPTVTIRKIRYLS